MAQSFGEDLARRIYQDSLEEICRAYFENDFEAFKTTIHVPHVYSTEGEVQRIESYDQMYHAFDCFREYLTGLGVTDFIRTCNGAAFITTEKIIGGHISELLHNGTRLRQPYEVWATLEHIDGQWKVVASENAIADTSWQAHAFRKGVEQNMNRPGSELTNNLPHSGEIND